jgi:hypothetical protein
MSFLTRDLVRKIIEIGSGELLADFDGIIFGISAGYTS